MIEISFQLSNGETESIAVDAVLEEQHRSTAVISEHPVEDGSNVSDHVRADQDTISLEIFVTNTPIVEQPSENVSGSFSETNIAADAAPSRDGNPILSNPGSPPTRLLLGILVPGSAAKWEAAPFLEDTETAAAELRGATVLQFDDVFDRVNFVYSVMQALLTTGTQIRIVTKLRTYEKMLLEEVTTPRDAKTGDAIKFNIVARQIRVVSTETVEAPPNPEQQRGRTRTNRGAQQTDDATEEETSRASLLMRANRALGLL